MTFLRVLLWVMSGLIWVFSAGFDGRFLRGLMPAGLLWGTFAYGLNFVADVSNEMFAYVFMRLQRNNRRGSKLWRWSFSLLIAQAGALYFGTVFSQAAIADARPDLAAHLQWSAALFAQFVLLFLGIAQALLDVRVKQTTNEPGRATIAAAAFDCPYCDRSFTTQNGRNAHMRSHKAKSNGRKREESEKITTRG